MSSPANVIQHFSQAIRFPGFRITKGAAGISKVTLVTGIPNTPFFLWLSDNGVRPDPAVPGVNSQLFFGDQSVDALGFQLVAFPAGITGQTALVLTDVNGFLSANLNISGGANPLDFWVASTPATGIFASRQLTNADFGP
jgi:hypothetical protein